MVTLWRNFAGSRNRELRMETFKSLMMERSVGKVRKKLPIGIDGFEVCGRAETQGYEKDHQVWDRVLRERVSGDDSVKYDKLTEGDKILDVLSL